jgi:hypothetical protein
MPEKLARQIAAFRSHNVDVVFSDAEHFSSDTGVQLPLDLFGHYVGKFQAAEMFNLLIRRNTIPFSSAVIKRWITDQVGLFDEARLSAAVKTGNIGYAPLAVERLSTG